MSNYIKHLLSVGALAFSATLTLHAQEAAPIIEFHTQLYEMHGAENSFHFYLGSGEEQYVDIDFGYGPMEYRIGKSEYDPSTESMKATVISGQVGPEGTVRVYGNAYLIDYLGIEGVYADKLEISKLVNLDVINVSHNLLGELDLTPQKRLYAVYVEDNPFDKKPFLLGADHPDLAILEMPNIGAVDQSLKLSDYPKLQSFDAYHTVDLRVCDPTKNPELLRLSIDCTNVETLDVSQNQKLLILNISQTKITDIDLSNNLNLVQLFCSNSGTLNSEYKLKEIDLSMLDKLQVFFGADNLFADIDISGCPELYHFTVQNNYLRTVDFSGNPDLYTVDISKNCMDFVTIPAVRPTFGEYYYYQRPFEFDRSYPEGGVLDLSSRLNRPNSITTARLICGEEALSSDFFTYDDGVITFNKVTPDSVYFEFNNTDFPEYGLQSSKFIVKRVEDFGKDLAVVNWQLSPSARSINLSVGIAGATPENPKRFSLDLGDGEIVDYSATSDKLPETPIVVTEKKKIGRMTLYIPEGEDLTGFSLTDSPVTAIDLTAAHSLTDLNITGCGLTDIDLLPLHRLRRINLNENDLSILDLSATDNSLSKTGLLEVYANDNQLEEFISNEMRTPTIIELANNQLSELSLFKCYTLERLVLAGNQVSAISLQDCEALSYLDVAGNELSALEIPDYTPLQTLDVSGNRFPLSNLPVNPDIDNYTYAPQQIWQMPEKAPNSNLSDQVVNVNGKTTEFKWYDAADDRELTSTEIEGNNGKFKFLPSVVGKTVYATWSNAAFPDFKGDAIYRSENLLAAEAPLHVIGTFTTTEAAPANIIMRSKTPNNYVYIDWAGDGDLEQFILNDKNYVEYPVQTYAGSDVKMYTYDDKDGISVFSLEGMKLNNADFSNMTDVQSLAIYNAGLKASQIKLPELPLSTLNLPGNEIKGLDLSSYTDLVSLNVQECGLTEFDASPFAKLQNLVVANNALKKFNLDNPVLWNLFATECELETIDLSKVPEMQQLFLSNNKLSTLDVSAMPKLNVLSIFGNRFTLTTLPRVLSSYSVYEYSNQALYPVKVQDGCVIDLSDQLLVGSNRTTYRWFRDANVGYAEDGSIVGDELLQGTDYTANEGVFTFITQVKDAVCVMTNIAFPNLVFLSAPVDIRGSGVDDVISEDMPFSVASSEGMVGVIGSYGTVSLFTIDGKHAGRVEATDGSARFDNVAAGIYIVTDTLHSAKVVVR